MSERKLPSRHDIKQELARRHLDDFAALMLEPMKAARHHSYVNERLEALERGDITRLMIFMPPGYAKSTYASQLFPAWYLGRHPKDMLIFASHTHELASSWGRKARNLFRLPEWPFETPLSSEKQGEHEWFTEQGGGYYAVGVGGSVTGRRADLGIIDDPIRSREDADSETIRDKVWDWWKADFRSRLKPNGRVGLIQTRWHEDDLAGRLLPENWHGHGKVVSTEGEEWEVINLPALAEINDPLGRNVGEPLWPEWFPLDQVLVEKAAQTERNWSALWQQRPSPEEGDYFRREWFRYYTEEPKPESLRLYGASDYAITAEGGDWTVHGMGGIDKNDDLYLLDWWRGQVDAAQAVDSWAHMTAKWRPVQWGEDKAQIEKALGPFIDKRQKELNVYVHREKLPTHGQDKAMRAQAIRGRISQGKVFFPAHAPWVGDLISELLHFPTGKHDDQVDVLSLFGRMLGTMRPARKLHMPARTDSGYNALRH